MLWCERKVTPQHTDLLREVEALENELFDNSFNATTIAEEIRTGAQCITIFTTDSELMLGYIIFREAQGITDILRIGVTHSHQGRGLGNALMHIPLSQSERCMLTVKKSNEGAIRLYRTLGFEIVGDLETNGVASGWVMATSAVL